MVLSIVKVADPCSWVTANYFICQLIITDVIELPFFQAKVIKKLLQVKNKTVMAFLQCHLKEKRCFFQGNKID